MKHGQGEVWSSEGNVVQSWAAKKVLQKGRCRDMTNEEKPIAAIETKYNGYKFRSRLEARWAVFFDAAGIEYEYEPEGFELDDGTRYLPDFYLPEFRIYVEIKRKGLSGEELETALEKCEKLFWACPCFVGLFMGDPLDNKMFLYCCTNTSGGGGYDWHRCEFISQCEADITLAVEMECDYSPIMNCEFGDFPEWGYCEYPNGYRYSDGTYLYPLDYEYDSCEAVMPTFEINDNYDFSSEKQKARQVRFEHGESPKL